MIKLPIPRTDKGTRGKGGGGGGGGWGQSLLELIQVQSLLQWDFTVVVQKF